MNRSASADPLKRAQITYLYSRGRVGSDFEYNMRMELNKLQHRPDWNINKYWDINRLANLLLEKSIGVSNSVQTSTNALIVALRFSNLLISRKDLGAICTQMHR